MSQVQGFRLSVQQQHIWNVREGGEAVWAQALLQVTGPLDTERLAAAVAEVISRHAILRTTYSRVPGVRSAVQVVTDQGAAPPAHRAEDLRHLGESAQRERIGRVAGDERECAGAVPATVLFTLGVGRHCLLLTTTPLSADAETLRLMAGALAQAYGGGMTGDTEPIEYAEVAEWQHQAGRDGPVAEAEALLALGTGPAAARSLPLQRAGGDRSAGTGTIEGPPAGAAVHTYAASRGVTPRTVLLAAWQVLLAHVGDQQDIVIGTRLDGRGYEELTDCLGHFAKWVPAAATVGPQTSFDVLTAGLGRELARADDLEEHLLVSYASTVTTWSAAFDCLTEIEPFPAGEVTFAVDRIDVAAEPYGVRLRCVVGVGTVRTEWSYRADRFDAEYVRCLAAQYDILLAELLARPGAPVRAMTCLDAQTRERLVHTFNQTGRDLAAGCLHHLFEAQARRTPDAPAVLDPARRLTYRELDDFADRLAHGLRAEGVGPESRVGVCLPHSVDLVAVILAVLKAGGAYVPLDPAQPRRRTQALVTDGGCRIVVLPADAPWEAGTAVRRSPEQLTAADPTTGHREADPENLAYVMFTSGSTGAPKGVMVPHRAVVNYLSWAAATYTGAPGAALMHSSVAFDLTITSLFLPLITGRTVHLDDAWRDIGALSGEVSTRRGAHLLKLTPSHLTVINRMVAGGELAGTTDCLVVGGEQLVGEAVRPWRRHAPTTRVFNEYGPTEAAVGCCAEEIVDEPAADAALPIGRPIANTRIYLLAADLWPVVVGAVGEIYIGGRSLARGYLGRPDLTADRFVPDPFSPGQRLYRTGDLACHGTDGKLRFLGRRDEQLKVRGARLEPAEVQAVLLSHPAVDGAVAAAGPQGQLIAYLVAADPEETDLDLRAFVAERLPAVMVPDSFRWIDAIPLTVNGKVDRSRLDGGAAPARTTVTAPGDAIELTVLRLIEELLNRAPVGVDEDFFEIGGHSLLAVRLIARINAAFGTELPVAVFFDRSTTRPATAFRLAEAVRTGARTTEQSLVLLRDGTETPLFCVHPAGGDIVGFRDLSLSDVLRRPLYGLQAPPEPSGEQSIEFLAAHYLAAVHEVQPAGPYQLLGWSMGGLVAFEMARRLTAVGEQVAMLTLVDTYPSDVLSDDVEAEAARHLAGELGRLVGAGLALDLQRLRDLPNDKAAQQVLDAAVTAGLVSSERERIDLERRVRLNHLHVQAAAGYRLGPYSGPITLVQASRTPPQLRLAGLAAWRRAGAVIVHELPGEHFSLFRRPAVDDLAKIIESAS
jgi:amino acid adenylation domain-containing protein